MIGCRTKTDNGSGDREFLILGKGFYRGGDAPMRRLSVEALVYGG